MLKKLKIIIWTITKFLKMENYKKCQKTETISLKPYSIINHYSFSLFQKFGPQFKLSWSYRNSETDMVFARWGHSNVCYERERRGKKFFLSYSIIFFPFLFLFPTQIDFGSFLYLFNHNLWFATPLLERNKAKDYLFLPLLFPISLFMYVICVKRTSICSIDFSSVRVLFFIWSKKKKN